MTGIGHIVKPGRYGFTNPVSHRRDLVVPSKQGWTRAKNLPYSQQARGRSGGEFRLAVVACCWQEESLVPFFLRHYWFADRLFIILGHSPDRSEELLRADPRVSISYLDMPEGLDDGKKRDAINNQMHQIQDFDWALVVDIDEFLFPEGDPNGDTFKTKLASVEPGANCIMARMANVFRHKTDKDLDPALPGPVVYQRMHGNPAAITGNAKPCVVRTVPVPSFSVGQHNVTPRHFSEQVKITGAHWQGADPSFSIHRVYDLRKQRLSPRNYRMNWGTGHYNATPELLKIAYEAHSHDPLAI